MACCRGLGRSTQVPGARECLRPDGGQEIFEILVLEQSSEQVARFPLGVVLHLAQILAIVVGT
jgi:hypothetical protein